VTSTQSETSQPAPVDTALTAEVAAFLFHEAQLLDDLELDAWLELFEADAQYVLPMGPKSRGTNLHVALICDDYSHLEDRVMRITGGASYSQNPPSRTMHQIGNVSVVADHGDQIVVTSHQIIVELRRGAQRTFAADCSHELRRNTSGFRIVNKTMYLLNRDEPLGDLTFIL
jgi:benzoate/toluate 1,2-dioxygenase beta subunit